MGPKEVVRRFFEALDAGNPDAVPELYSDDCKIYRPELREPLVGIEMVQLLVTMALFRLRDNKIAEERVYRDELGMLLDVGAIEPARG